MRVYDPRDNQWKESTNPALMIAQFSIPESARFNGDDAPLGFGINWQAVAEMADYCDEVPYGTLRIGDSLVTGKQVFDPREPPDKCRRITSAFGCCHQPRAAHPTPHCDEFTTELGQ